MKLHFRPFDADNHQHRLERRVSNVVSGLESMPPEFRPAATGTR